MVNINEEIDIHFPLELKPREQQIEALEFCKKSINHGRKNMLLNMPTGSGKSYFIVMFANWYRNFVNKEAKFDILTNSKILQDQYIRDFPFMRNLKGMSNYYCNNHKTDCGEGKEINKVLKKVCDNCPYDSAKYQWMSSDIAISNYALFISMALYTDTLIKKDSNVLVIDESHDFEATFCDFISTRLNKNLLKKCGFNQSTQFNYNKLFKKVKTPEDFIQFIEEGFIFDLQKLHDNHIKRIGEESEKTIKASYRKQMVYTGKLIERLENLILTYHKNKDNWSLDITYKDKDIELNFQPIWGYPYLKSILWKNYDHIIFMSGTLLDKGMFSYINGLEPELTTYKEMDSTFDIKKRPLYYMKAGKMTYKEKVNTFNEQVKLIEKILKKYENEKGIIHTFNYEIANWIEDRIKDKRLIFHTSDNRDKMYDKFLNSKKPSVMVSPSMMSGVDLKDDLSRFAIMLKIPYPNISSNKIKDRQKSNRNWYNWKTVVDIIQTYGRTVRSHEDYADTFILDSSLSNIMKYNSKYLPRYFTDAIKTLK